MFSFDVRCVSLMRFILSVVLDKTIWFVLGGVYMEKKYPGKVRASVKRDLTV